MEKAKLGKQKDQWLPRVGVKKGITGIADRTFKGSENICMILLYNCGYMWTHLSKPMNVQGFPGDSDGKEFICNVGDPGSVPGLGRSPGEGNGYSLQYSCLENPTDREVWQAIVTK